MNDRKPIRFNVPSRDQLFGAVSDALAPISAPTTSIKQVEHGVLVEHGPALFLFREYPEGISVRAKPAGRATPDYVVDMLEPPVLVSAVTHMIQAITARIASQIANPA